ncbi:tyrosine kinase-like protein [Cystoisospora suis]|uniref:Tyrosine kinase-like protein n=1 Tax=Cystoisospora suis TaxID=483139 RepID=A0A2C6KX51_9APIC|nr:tyrosine kinase-like protein [Cystoisospora suis]
MISLPLQVADFGVATAFVPSDSPSVLALYGNVFYAAPEVLRGDGFYPASDVWSYGVAFWEALTGKLAYEGMNGGLVFTRVAAGLLSLKIPKDFPPPLRFLISRLLAFDPAERPSFQEIAFFLEDMQAKSLSAIERDLDDFFGL